MFCLGRQDCLLDISESTFSEAFLLCLAEEAIQCSVLLILFLSLNPHCN